MFNQDLLEKRQKLIDMGVNPYPYSFKTTTTIQQIINNPPITNDDKEGKSVSVTGRIVAQRKQGKVFFIDIEDLNAKIQLYFRKNEIGEEKWKVLNLLDIGDIIGVNGRVFITKMGELTIWIDSFELLSKSLVRVPISKSTDEKTYYELSDPEIIYKERYTYWIVNKKAREIVLKRTKIISEIRKFMDNRGFLEVNTPNIEMVYGGAEARPFEITIHALNNQRAFLRISPELYLKRYIVGGFPKVYTICQNFRNEGIDRSHNPEFTMLEWYEAYTDYEDQMKQFEELVSTVAISVCGTTKITYQGQEINLTPPWKRLSMIEALKQISGIDIENMSDDEIKNCILQNNLELPKVYNRGIAMVLLYDKLCEDKIIQPTFITDHPVEISPLTKPKRGKPGFVERFEPIICGMELGNAYSELTDPVEQYERLKKQREFDENNPEGIVHHPVDLDFIKAIASGMPPTGGVGLGIDRLIMLLTDSHSIRDIIPFPMTKPQKL